MCCYSEISMFLRPLGLRGSGGYFFLRTRERLSRAGVCLVVRVCGRRACVRTNAHRVSHRPSLQRADGIELDNVEQAGAYAIGAAPQVFNGEPP